MLRPNFVRWSRRLVALVVTGYALLDSGLAAAQHDGDGATARAGRLRGKSAHQLSQNEPGGGKKTKAKKAALKEKSADERDDGNAPAKKDSSGNRKTKQWVVVAETGLIDLLHSGYGAEVGRYLSPDTVLEADYLHSNFEFLGFQSKIDLATVRVKWFLGNSFYLQGGGGLRQMQATDSSVFFSSLIGADTYTSTFASNYAIGEVGLGNRWQFANFTIGCDWVGYAVPLGKLSSSESFSGPISATQKASDRDNFEKRSGQGNLLLLRFHLGASF